MVVIYTQDETLIRNDADASKDVLIAVYGEKIGKEDYAAVKDAQIGTSYRKYGGPLVQVVTKERSEKIRIKEASIGMM